jgi:hypothetical protein
MPSKQSSNGEFVFAHASWGILDFERVRACRVISCDIKTGWVDCSRLRWRNLTSCKYRHVWNRDNVEKVLVDERKHREKQEKERHRQEQIASERRRNLLRARKAGDAAPAKTDGIAMNGAASDVLDDEELPALGGFQVR